MRRASRFAPRSDIEKSDALIRAHTSQPNQCAKREKSCQGEAGGNRASVECQSVATDPLDPGGLALGERINVDADDDTTGINPIAEPVQEVLHGPCLSDCANASQQKSVSESLAPDPRPS